MSNYALEVLRDNKKLFTTVQYTALLAVAKVDRYDYRKAYEDNEPRIAYLPSFNQRVTDKLASIGLMIESVRANDGSQRKIYALRPLKGGL
ncbi:hypothetical protein [Vibrio rumoiensis]|uniref:Uncharacterized protein n=1 Tax=Vibrio rumoiensis TaxID=76258 RepID=A0ABW7J0E0_9VIBR